jgi:hypothetical protein
MCAGGAQPPSRELKWCAKTEAGAQVSRVRLVCQHTSSSPSATYPMWFFFDSNNSFLKFINDDDDNNNNNNNINNNNNNNSF